MAAQKQDDQLERTFSSYVRIQVVVLKTYLGRWTIGRSGERGSGISVLPARYDDDDIYIYDIQSASEDNGYGLFAYRIYEEFHISLLECSMYGNCYIFSIKVYITKLTYRAYTRILEENSNQVYCHYEFIASNNIIIFFVSSDDSTRLICGWKTAMGNQRVKSSDETKNIMILFAEINL